VGFALGFPLSENDAWAELTSMSDLQAATNQSRVDFLQTDLALCFTFADLAKTEYQSGDRDAARRILEKAEIGYATIAGFLGDVENPDQKSEIAKEACRAPRKTYSEQHCLKRHGGA
jgi:hypothetical protein